MNYSNCFLILITFMLFISKNISSCLNCLSRTSTSDEYITKKNVISYRLPEGYYYIIYNKYGKKKKFYNFLSFYNNRQLALRHDIIPIWRIHYPDKYNHPFQFTLQNIGQNNFYQEYVMHSSSFQLILNGTISSNPLLLQKNSHSPAKFIAKIKRNTSCTFYECNIYIQSSEHQYQFMTKSGYDKFIFMNKKNRLHQWKLIPSHLVSNPILLSSNYEQQIQQLHGQNQQQMIYPGGYIPSDVEDESIASNDIEMMNVDA